MTRTTLSDVQKSGLAIATTPGLTSAQRTNELLPIQRGSDLPFAPESTSPYGERTTAQRKSVAKKVAAAKDAGASGDELRALFGALLSGPARRKVLRDQNLADGRIAPSYDAYRDGDQRIGTRHAREHGAEAAARRAEEDKKAAAKLRRAARAADRKAAKEAAASSEDAS